MTAAALVFALVSLQGRGGPASPESLPAFARVSIEVQPPVWIEGDPLRLFVTVENPSPHPIRIPAAWFEGQGIYLRGLPTERPGASGVAKEPAFGDAVALAPAPAPSNRADAVADVLLVGGARIRFPLAFPHVSPPDGVAFELFFLSSSPQAGSAAVRVERCEDLRGAKAHLETEAGRITFALAPETAPLAVRNFVRLAESGFYDGVAFHRIVKGLCIQGGDPDSKSKPVSEIAGTGGSTFDGRPLPLERSLAAFDRGTVGLARTPDLLYMNVRAALAQTYGVETGQALDARLAAEWPSAHALEEGVKYLTSGRSQFFICTKPAPHFNGRYAAFAKVVDGMAAVDRIEASEILGAQTADPALADRPAAPIRILRVSIERPPKSSAKAK